MVSVSHTSSNSAPSSGGGGGGSSGVARVASGGSVPLYPPSAVVDAVPNSTTNESPGRQAKVLYDYDAADMKELSLIADEVRQHFTTIVFILPTCRGIENTCEKCQLCVIYIPPNPELFKTHFMTKSTI